MTIPDYQELIVVELKPKATIIQVIEAARALMPMRKRGSNFELYSALVLAMQAVELCLADKNEDAALDEVIAKLPRGNKNRQYVERGSDSYQRVCRYVFFGEENRANISRYAISLREASKQGVTAHTLLEKLYSGGVNQFYLHRPLSNKSISTKCIRLDQQITHKKTVPFTLKLCRNDNNSYSILELVDAAITDD